MTALESLNFDLGSLASETFKMAILDQMWFHVKCEWQENS